MGDFKKALFYRHKAIAISKMMPSPDKEISLNIDYGNLINYYKRIDNKDSIRYYLYKTLECSNKIDTVNNSFILFFNRC